MRRRTWTLLALVIAAAGVIGVGGLLTGVELHRRWPLEGLERRLERWSVSLRPIDPWAFRSPALSGRYEAIAAVVDGDVVMLGGFHTASIEATPRVERYRTGENRWERLGDMPEPVTHAVAALRGGELWIAGGFVGDNPGPTTAVVRRYDVRTDQWSLGPPLPESRAGGALVALADGTLHYIGGWRSDRQTPSGDHWRLAAGDSVWVSVAPLPRPRGHFSAAVIGSHIYVIGWSEWHDPFPIDLPDVHRYDAQADEWTEVAFLPEARSHAEPGTVVHDGRIYVVGGRSHIRGKLSVAEVVAYDPPTNTWSYVVSLPRPLFAPVAAVLGEDLFVTVGGERGTLPRNRQSWSAPLGARWRPGPAMPAAIGEVAGGVIGTDLILVGEGDRSTLAMNVGTGEWESAGARAVRPAWGHHHAAEVIENELYLIGGLSSAPTARSLSWVQIYNPASDVWRMGPALPYPVGSAASTVINGRVYLAGGIVVDTTMRQALVLDPGAGAWRAVAPMPRPRNHAASATDGTRFFVFGGRGPGSGDGNTVANGYDDVQIYDPASDTWVASGDGPGAPAPLPQARGGMGKAVYVNGEFWVMGGETLDGDGATSDGVYARVDIYNPVTNQWRAGPALRWARHGIFPLVHGAAIWVAGGGIRSAASTSAVVEVLFPAR